tara:strand:- start:63 stop:590 length:528 start_codon:yes stop_codon:yes gene_type:complete
MISTEGPFAKPSGLGNLVVDKSGGGHQITYNIPSNWVNDNKKWGAHGLPLSYNVGFGSTLPTAAWLDYTAEQCDAAGISTAGMDPNNPKETKKVQVDVPAANFATVRYYGDQSTQRDAGRGFFELYEKADERKARHQALKDAGYLPPYPRADRFYKNQHQGRVQVGLSTSEPNKK